MVATADVDESLLRDHVCGSEIRVVAPASDMSALEWLMNDEDDARARAEHMADSTATAVADDAAVEAETGDTDPIQAAEDALRVFAADRILVVFRPQDEASWSSA